MARPEEPTLDVVIFRLNGQRYGLPVHQVVELARAVVPVPLPNAPPIVEGVIDVHGRIAPVLDVRSRFGLPRREVEHSDDFILANAGDRLVALHTDDVEDVARIAASAVTYIDLSPHFAGVARLEDGLVLIHDLESFLSADESVVLTSALNSASEQGENAP